MLIPGHHINLRTFMKSMILVMTMLFSALSFASSEPLMKCDHLVSTDGSISAGSLTLFGDDFLAAPYELVVVNNENRKVKSKGTLTALGTVTGSQIPKEAKDAFNRISSKIIGMSADTVIASQDSKNPNFTVYTAISSTFEAMFYIDFGFYGASCYAN